MSCGRNYSVYVLKRFRSFTPQVTEKFAGRRLN